MSARIELRHVSKVYGDDPHRALTLLAQGADKHQVLADTGSHVGLYDVSLSIPAGGIYAIMGLSGSGKSTLVRHINRLIDPSAGQVLVDGEDVLGFSAARLRDLRRRRISMVFQHFGLLPHRTVLENVAFGRRVRGESRRNAQAAAQGWLARVGLSGHERDYPDHLSGGMRQRVGLARALASDTDILLMDEPFSALDPLLRDDLQSQLLTLQAELGKTIVFITHDVEEAFRLGQRIALLRDGRLVQEGEPAAVRAAPVDDYVARFVARVSGADVPRSTGSAPG
ncbi:ATP-binding cassette domain-containing protein [Chitiniphilus eburneus]|uniref:ATP-binding cassette domain-containing protein n=1 Tax=Chitiniphilus eburneus TaxID=2571148 RepID=A0A4V5MQL2_9NEIS|nr:ATP-binding cassette domain-containing protein [Chitiniphilus eburneus]TJZ72998.1 ATP-binding cassette domain-containing protein [Chitiniphilus eburneus]